MNKISSTFNVDGGVVVASFEPDDILDHDWEEHVTLTNEETSDRRSLVSGLEGVTSALKCRCVSASFLLFDGEPAAHALQRLPKSLRPEWLEQVVQSIEFERRVCIIVVGGGKDYLRLVANPLQHLQSIHFWKFDIE